MEKSAEHLEEKIEFLDDIAEFNRNMVSANHETVKRYEERTKKYEDYKKKNNLIDSLETCRGFFSNLSKNYSGKSLWVVFSSLTYYFNINSIDIKMKADEKIKGFLKAMTSREKTKKAKVITKDLFVQFLKVYNLGKFLIKFR
jgi:hypothetical protein